MPRYRSWEVSEALWTLVEPLIPKRERDQNKSYQRKAGGGRKPLDKRRVFEGIVYVLRTGIPWKALPREYGSASAIHRYFQEWEAVGFFQALWERGLMEYDEMAGIAWAWQAVDGSHTKAPLGQEEVGRNPTDRGKKWEQAAFAGRRAWRPVVDRRIGSQSP